MLQVQTVLTSNITQSESILLIPRLASNDIKRSETLTETLTSSQTSSKTDSRDSRMSKLSVSRLGQDGDCQTEEFRLWCANCDSKVQWRPLIGPDP